MASAHTVARDAKQATKHTAANPGLEFLERAGYVFRGVLYAVMGLLAMGLALNIRGGAVDQSGSLVLITGNSAGRILLLFAVVSLAAYSLWGFVRAIFDPLRRGDDAAGIADRLGFAWSGTAYASLAVFALKLLVGTGSTNHGDTVQSTIARVMTYPAGRWIATGIGVIAIIAGLAQFVEAFRASFRKDLKLGEMSEAERATVDTLGRLGMFARGVTFTIVGWFVFQGGLHQDPSQVHGYGGAFVTLLQQPFGHQLLAAVALGFIALGAHSFACARWIRMLSSSVQ